MEKLYGMGKNNNKSVKVVHGGNEEDEESKNQPIRFHKKKEVMPTAGDSDSDDQG